METKHKWLDWAKSIQSISQICLAYALLVQESHDLKWCMPGGWIDIDNSIKEAAIKEVKEESGIDCAPSRIISVFDRRLNAASPALHTIFTFFVQCDYLGGQFEENLETIASGFFGLKEIPELSENKTTLEQIKQCFLAKGKPLYQTTFQ